MSLNLLQRINEVRKAIDYIQKDKSVSTGQGGSYKAVTHDTVTAMVREHMVAHGIVCWPYLVDSTMVQPLQIEGEKTSKQWRYEATYDFTFANIEDAKDFLVIRIQSHAMDNADKAPGKALSYGKKNAVLKLFEIETGESDESRFNPEGLEDEAFAELLDKINTATDQGALKVAYTSAYRTASEINDKEAQKLIIRAKDARKTVLAKGQK